MENIETKKFNIIDFFMIIMLIAMLAFKDYSNISIITQVLFIFITVINMITHKKVDIISFKYLGYKILFLIFCFISSIWSVNTANVYSACFTIALRMLTGFAIILYIRDREQLKKFLLAYVFASFVLCCRMVLVVPMDAWGKIRVGNYLSHDINNSYENTGITYVLGFAITYLMMSKDLIKNKKLKYVLIAMFTLFSLLSGSKKQIILLITNILVIALFKSKNILKILSRLLFATIGILILLFCVFNNKYLYNVLGQRIEGFIYTINSDDRMSVDYSTGVDVSTSARLFLIQDAYNTFKQNAFLGVGTNCFKEVGTMKGKWAENNFFELLADLGIIGFILYYSLYIYIITNLLKRIRDRNIYDILLIACLISFLIIDFTMVTYMNNTLQLNLAIIYAINRIRMKESKEVKSTDLIMTRSNA